MIIITKYKLIKALLLTSVMLLFISFSFAGAWPEKKGGGYYKLSFRYLKGNKIYNNSGDKSAIPDFTDITIGFYGTYGLTDNVTLTLNAIPYKSVKLDTTINNIFFDEEVTAPGDLGLGIKYCFLKTGKTIFSSSLKLGFPTGKSSLDGRIWTGRKDFNQTIAFEAGHSFYPSGFYLSELISFSNRNEGFSDEFRYLIEGGYNLGSGFTVIGRFHGLVSLKNGDENVIGGYGIFMNNSQYYAYNIELVYKINKNFGVSAYYESGGGGKNIISAPVINASFFYTL